MWLPQGVTGLKSTQAALSTGLWLDRRTEGPFLPGWLGCCHTHFLPQEGSPLENSTERIGQGLTGPPGMI